MPIQVTCQKCHKRFTVNEKFAGKSGPCPSCKEVIKIPDKEDEVVIHSPDGYGPKDASGKAILKPIEREEVEAKPVVVVGIVAAIVASILVAVGLRFAFKPTPEVEIDPTLWWILAGGAVVLAPLIALAGYWFLRNDELEPYRGGPLAIRVLICGAIYAGLWGAYAAVKQYMFPNAQPEMFHFALIGPAFLAVGGSASLATLDLDFGNGAIHYAFYLLVTVLFCFLIGVPAY